MSTSFADIAAFCRSSDSVMSDLIEYQAKIDRYQAEEHEYSKRFHQRYEFLTKDAAGIALVLEQIQCYEKAIDREMFALFNVWKNRSGEEVKKKADDLCHVLNECAARMAHEWAKQEMQKTEED